MTCERLSDRMPRVMAGKDRWSGDEEEHLNGCADCRREWQLLARGAALGADLPPLDTARMSAQLRQRLTAAHAESRNARRAWVVAAMAVAATLLLVVFRPPASGPAEVSGPVAVNGLELPVIELDSLSAEQLRTVLESLEAPLGSSSTLDAPSLQDLDDHQLERLLRSLEG